MRNLVIVALVSVMAGAAACAPKIIPAPVVTTPRFPELIQPPIPPALIDERAAVPYDRGWRFLQAGDFKAAERELSLAERASPAFYPADAAMGYLELARQDWKSALTHFDRVLEQHGDYVSALVGRGVALAALSREAEAIAAFDAAVAADPSLTDVRRRVEVLKFQGVERNLAAARQAARSGNFDEAIRTYQTAILSSPDSAFLYRELGAVERQKGEVDPALEHLSKAVALDPSDASSLGQIGELLEARGDLAGALASYNRSLALESNGVIEGRRGALMARAELDRLPEQYRAIDAAPEVTRADLAALIGVRLGPLLSTMRSSDLGVVTDVRNNWAESWILSVARAGAMDSYPNHTFQPATIVRRIDLAEAVSRLLGRIATPEQIKSWESTFVRFPDLAESHLAYPSASVAVASGMMPAAADGSFQPSRPVTGSEAVAAVERLQTMAGALVGQPSGRR